MRLRKKRGFLPSNSSHGGRPGQTYEARPTSAESDTQVWRAAGGPGSTGTMRKPSKEGPGRKQHGRVTPALDDDRRRPGRKGLWLLAIFAFALLLRLIVLHRLLGLPLHRTPQ